MMTIFLQRQQKKKQKKNKLTARYTKDGTIDFLEDAGKMQGAVREK